MTDGELWDWRREGARRVREYRFSGYSEAVRFATEIGRVAETESAIPLIHVGYRTVLVEVPADASGERLAHAIESIRLDEDDDLTED